MDFKFLSHAWQPFGGKRWNPTETGVVRHVRRHDRALARAVAAWASGPRGHRAFAELIVRLEADFRGFPHSLWEQDPEMAWLLVSEHNTARRLVLAAYDAIEELRRIGYVTDAPPEAKRQVLAALRRRYECD